MYHNFSIHLVVLDGESVGIERSSVGTGYVEQYAVILHSEIHVHIVRREGQVSSFRGTAEVDRLNDRQVVAVAITGVNSSRPAA